MAKFIPLSVAALSAVLLHGHAANAEVLLAQAETPPPVEQAAPVESAPVDAAPDNGDQDRKGKRDRRSNGDESPPPRSSNAGDGADNKDRAPKERAQKPKGPPEDAANGEPKKPAEVGEEKRRDKGNGEPPRELPEQSAAPAKQPESPPEPKRDQEQAAPANPDQPRAQPNPQEESQKAASPPPKQQQPAPPPGKTAQPQPDATSPKSDAPSAERREQRAAPSGKTDDASPRRRDQRAGTDANMNEVKKRRRERTENGGKRTVIEEPGNRVIVKEGGRTTIRHDETERLRRTSRDVRREKRQDGSNVTIAVRPGGIEIYSVFDSSGHLERRYRRGRDGREVNLIDNRHRRGDRGRDGIGFYLDLRPPRVGIPRERYIVDYTRASEQDVYDALIAPPVDSLDRRYSLDEVRYNRYLRDRMRRVDLDTINFAFGSWDVAPSQYDKLSRVARAMNRILDRRPDEIFLIEGYTDAVGSDIDNLTLSDRRAEEVAYILTESFNVPPENLVTQGYGEQYLKINTQQPERANRRVAVRRITPLMARR